MKVSKGQIDLSIQPVYEIRRDNADYTTGQLPGKILIK